MKLFLEPILMIEAPFNYPDIFRIEKAQSFSI